MWSSDHEPNQFTDWKVSRLSGTRPRLDVITTSRKNRTKRKVVVHITGPPPPPPESLGRDQT